MLAFLSYQEFRAPHIVILLTFAGQVSQPVSSVTIAPARMPQVATVDPRFVSYNIEMVEVTGGRFWKPYAEYSDANSQAGTDQDRFENRPPIDLANSRLRNLAKSIGPAYVRVSGSWANTTYFQDDDNPALKQPPAGFDDVLTRAEWRGVVEFSHAVGGRIMTSFVISPGTRGADGVWKPAQAKALLKYTQALGSGIAAAEFMNEPTVAAMHGAPKGYDAAAFAKDIMVFSRFLRKESPGTLLVGPGGRVKAVPWLCR